MKTLIAQAEHRTIIYDILSHGKQLLQTKHIPQWSDAYPGYADIDDDIARQQAYLVMDDQRYIGTFVLAIGPEPSYQQIDGQWLTADQIYGTIHRIAVAENTAGKGYGQALFAAAEQVALAKQLYSIRIDTHQANQTMLHLIAKNNYKKCGVIIVYDGTPRFAFEKIIG